MPCWLGMHVVCASPHEYFFYRLVSFSSDSNTRSSKVEAQVEANKTNRSKHKTNRSNG